MIKHPTSYYHMFELWKAYGWNAEEPVQGPLAKETWCHGFEGPAPEPEPEVKVERGTER
jgi:hypothetical protein